MNERKRTPEGFQYGQPEGIEATIDTILLEVDREENWESPEGIRHILGLIEARLNEASRLASMEKVEEERAKALEIAKIAVDDFEKLGARMREVIVEQAALPSEQTDSLRAQLAHEGEILYTDLLSAATRLAGRIPPEKNPELAELIKDLEGRIDENRKIYLEFMKELRERADQVFKKKFRGKKIIIG